jgi:hypothetical protein
MPQSVSRALEDLARHNVSVTVEDASIRVIYHCSQSALPAVKNAIATLRQHKQEAITFLTGGGSAPEGRRKWSSENLYAQERFECLAARLYPFIGRRVRTTLGLGTVLRVSRNRVTVLLDVETTKPEKGQKANCFRPTDICPLELM